MEGGGGVLYDDFKERNMEDFNTAKRINRDMILVYCKAFEHRPLGD